MGESYSDAGARGTAGTPAEVVLARELVALLVPGADPALLTAALLAERGSAAPGTEEEAAARELQRVRAQLALGESARMLQHALNNPLTALLAEAQMLEMEPLTDQQHASVRRVVELARRLAAMTRGLDAAGAPRTG